MALDRTVKVPKKTGKLERQTFYRIVPVTDSRSSFTLKLWFGSKPDYSKYVNEGTRPHVIKPKRSSVLAWADAQTGKMVYAKEVHHPGTKPNQYLGEALVNVMGFSRVRKRSRR